MKSTIEQLALEHQRSGDCTDYEYNSFIAGYEACRDNAIPKEMERLENLVDVLK